MTPARPTTVNIATALQVVVVLLAIGSIVLVWLGQPPVETRDASVFAAIASTTLASLVAVWFGATMLPAWRGSNTARIMVAVGAGFYQLIAVVLCVCSGLFAFLMLPVTMMPEDYPYGRTQEPMTWGLFAAGMAFLLIAVALMAVLVLLVVPPSHRWYSAKRTA
ncbi:MAG TPA: hypothetical protein DGG94_16935 [Micromonosporaceae bacterium]|nr:hypothetical protein [Micromonosporaceae bacterium]HCU51457.1 hypothetical protein [Micromonosporaceae bacterium]